MITFDSDVLSSMFIGEPAISLRASLIPIDEQSVPIVVIEELIRGRLNTIRQAEAGKATVSIERSYELLELTIAALRKITVLPYNSKAHSLFLQWRDQKIKVGTHDLRVAAICIAHSAKLISRNRRDFDKIPGLLVEYW